MQQSSDDTSSGNFLRPSFSLKTESEVCTVIDVPWDSCVLGHSKVQSNISKEMGSGAWGVMSTSDVYHASNDATLFSTSLPVLPHDKCMHRLLLEDIFTMFILRNDFLLFFFLQ